MMLVSPEMTPSLPPSASSCCSTVDDRGFLEHEVSRMYGITIMFGVEVILRPPAVVFLVASDCELFC
jgi:hypothetical protein